MRIVAGILFVLIVCAAAQANEYPYRAVVAHLNVSARSAPSYGAYPTEALAKGSEVEVHKAGPKGWVAIRPTPEAFDWIDAASIQATEDPAIGVTAVETAVQIGSNVRDIEKPRSETTLKTGEAVELLGGEASAAAEQKGWLRIAPPAGEFRWVQEKFLTRETADDLAAREAEHSLAREEERLRENVTQPPGLLDRLAQSAAMRKLSEVVDDPAAIELTGGKAPPILNHGSATLPTATDENSTLELAPPKFESRVPAESARTTAPRTERIPLSERTARSLQRRPTSQPQSETQIETRSTIDPKLLRGVEKETARRTETAPEENEMATAPAPSRRSPPLGSAEFRDLLHRLEVDLTEMVAAESTQWRLDSLRARAAALVEDGGTPLERGRARLLLERIEAFAGTLPPDQETYAAPNLALAPRSAAEPTTRPAAPAPAFGAGPQYDAVGYLMPVLGAPAGTPAFQLTDAQGNTLQFVSSAPGLNLGRYEKKQVGIYGRRGYLESVKKQHVVAERVVDLDRHKR